MHVRARGGVAVGVATLGSICVWLFLCLILYVNAAGVWQGWLCVWLGGGCSHLREGCGVWRECVVCR